MSKEWFTKIKENNSGETPKRTVCSWAMPLLYITRITSVIFFVADFIVLIFCEKHTDLMLLCSSLICLFWANRCLLDSIFAEILEDIRDGGLRSMNELDDLAFILISVMLLIAGIILCIVSVII